MTSTPSPLTSLRSRTLRRFRVAPARAPSRRVDVVATTRIAIFLCSVGPRPSRNLACRSFQVASTRLRARAQCLRALVHLMQGRQSSRQGQRRVTRAHRRSQAREGWKDLSELKSNSVQVFCFFDFACIYPSMRLHYFFFLWSSPQSSLTAFLCSVLV